MSGPDRGDEHAVGREGDRADDAPAIRFPRRHWLRVAVEIDRPDGVRRAAALSRRRRIQHGAHADRCGPLRVGRKERRRLLNVLARWQAEHVQRAVARHDVHDTRRTSKKAARFFLAGRARNSLGHLTATCGRHRRRSRCGSSSCAWRCARWRCAGGTTDSSLDRHALPRFAQQAAVPDSAAATAEWVCARRSRRPVKGHDARGAGRHSARARRGGCRNSEIELTLPQQVAKVVVDPVDAVRATSDERHRYEERHAACRHTLCETLQPARPVAECGLPLQLEPGLRQRRHGNLVVGADPRRALRVGQGRQPLRSPASDLRQRGACGEESRHDHEDTDHEDTDRGTDHEDTKTRRKGHCVIPKQYSTPSNVAMYARPFATVRPLK